MTHLLFFNSRLPSKFYTLSLHDALPIFPGQKWPEELITHMKIVVPVKRVVDKDIKIRVKADGSGVELANVKMRSEEHTSELQSRRDLVCRLLLEKKNEQKVVASLQFQIH